MEVEEKVNKEFWYVLQEIKESSLKTKAGSLVEYLINYKFVVVSTGYPFPKDEEKILEKLEEIGAIKIVSSREIYEYV